MINYNDVLKEAGLTEADLPEKAKRKISEYKLNCGTLKSLHTRKEGDKMKKGIPKVEQKIADLNEDIIDIIADVQAEREAATPPAPEIKEEKTEAPKKQQREAPDFLFGITKIFR